MAQKKLRCDSAGCHAETLLQQLPTTVMISAAEDIDLGAEPEEGAAAALAEARDLAEKSERLAQEALEKFGDGKPEGVDDDERQTDREASSKEKR